MYIIPTAQRGFIALISITIVSVVLFVSTLSLAQFGIASRFFMLDIENKIASEKLAEACVEYAQISVYNDPYYILDTPRVVLVGKASCSIISITKNGNESTIRTKGTRGDAVTNLEVVVDTTTGNLLSWEEISTF
jgi:hypothetical protein